MTAYFYCSDRLWGIVIVRRLFQPTAANDRLNLFHKNRFSHTISLFQRNHFVTNKNNLSNLNGLYYY